MALLVRQWASAIFRYAVATLRADTDPAAALKGAIHRPKVEHHKPLSRDQMADFVKALDGYGGYRTTVIALRLMLLTFVRTVELRAAHWAEIDLDRAEWRIPAERMKMREPHIVPLSRQAVELLRGTAYPYRWAQFPVPELPQPENLHDGNDAESGAGTHGLQRQRQHRLFGAWLPGDGFNHPERNRLSA